MFNRHLLTSTAWHEHPHREQFDAIRSIVSGIDYVHVMSTTYDSCVVIAPSEQLALITSDLLLSELGIISKTIPGHFIDCFYIAIRYN